MADDTRTPVWRPLIGELNPRSRKRPGIVDHFPDDLSLNRPKVVINEFFADALRKPIKYPATGICLHAEIKTYQPGETVPGGMQLQVSSMLGMPTKILEVVAHIPLLDFLLEIPPVMTQVEDESVSDWHRFLLLLHAKNDRLFRADMTGADNIKIPSPGDFISVDFNDRVGRSGAKYLGIAKKGLGYIPPAPGGDSDTSTQNAFDIGGEPTLMAEHSTSEAEQAAEQQEIVNDKLDEYAKEYAAETGMSEDAARGYLESMIK